MHIRLKQTAIVYLYSKAVTAKQGLNYRRKT
jgi:hypothetical protein